MPVRARGLFWGCGYRVTKKKLTFPTVKNIFSNPHFPIYCFGKSLVFCVVSVTLIAQPKPRLGYTEKKFSVTERQKIGAILSPVRVTLELNLSVTHY